MNSPTRAYVEFDISDIVREIAEAEGRAAEVLEPSVDRLRRPVAGAGSVEEREHVRGALLQRPAEASDLDERGRDAGGDRVDHGLHHLLALLLVGLAVRGDHALIDTPGRFDLDVLLGSEQYLQPDPLPVGEQLVAGVEGATCMVERVALHPAPPEQVLLDSTPADIQRVAGETDHVERVHDGDRVGQFFRGGGLEPGEPVHRDHLDLLAPFLRTSGEPLLEYRFRASFNHVQQPGRPGLVPGRGQVDDHGDVLVAEPGVPPDMLVDTERGHALEAGRVIDEAPAALGEDRAVRGMPGHPETGGGTGHGEMVDHDRFQRPPEPAAGDLRPRRRGLRGVLPPRLPAVPAPIAAHPHQQRRGPVPERLVREATHDGVAHDALGAALPAPRIRLDNATLDHRPIRLEPLPDGFEAELIETAERGQIGCSEGSVEQRRGLSDGQPRNFHPGRPRPLSTNRPAHPSYTLNCEEPVAEALVFRVPDPVLTPRPAPVAQLKSLQLPACAVEIRSTFPIHHTAPGTHPDESPRLGGHPVSAAQGILDGWNHESMSPTRTMSSASSAPARTISRMSTSTSPSDASLSSPV